MKILILCKRRPQDRDLFLRPYGRFYFLPLMLANLGHEVHMILLGYKKEPVEYKQEGNLHWYSFSVFPYGPWHFFILASQLTKEIQPDWVIGFSDIWYGLIAEYIARKHNSRSLIDAYDNYESYIAILKPVHWMWRRALARADAVTAAGPQLGSKMSESAGGRHVDIVPMAADPHFKPMDKTSCRRKLGLPADKILMGYTGSIHTNRNIHLLLSGMEKIRPKVPNSMLVLSGRLQEGLNLPKDIIWLGYLSDEKVPLVYNSLDLLIVMSKPGSFGDFSYPAKLYEAMACDIPLVATDLPGTSWILQNHKKLLFNPTSTDDFINKIMANFSKKITYHQTSGWYDSFEAFKQVLMLD
jgi:glycosyltransferase involved in cell wall biosynthesis